MKMKQIVTALVLFFAFAPAVFTQERLLTIDDIFSPTASERVAFGGSP
jgi:hypothetical protein